MELFAFVAPFSLADEETPLCSLLFEVDVDWLLGVAVAFLEVAFLVASVVFEGD